MPFGKTIKRVEAYINMENGFDIEVYTLIVLIKYLKFLHVTLEMDRYKTQKIRASSP